MFNKKLEDDYDILCAGVECLLNQKNPFKQSVFVSCTAVDKNEVPAF